MDKKLPVPLIKKLIKAKMKKNDEKNDPAKSRIYYQRLRSTVSSSGSNPGILFFVNSMNFAIFYY